MKKFIVMSWLAICAAAMFVSCEQADEVPPVENKISQSAYNFTGYILP